LRTKVQRDVVRDSEGGKVEETVEAEGVKVEESSEGSFISAGGA
jgi:hypothetical protein